MLSIRTALPGIAICALAACTESDAPQTSPPEPSRPAARPLAADEVRLGLIEEDGEGGYRWRAELGADIRSISYGVVGSGETRGVSGTNRSAQQPATLEIAYSERESTGARILEDVETLGDEAAREAVLEAAPGFEDASLRRFTLRVGGTALHGVVPDSTFASKPTLTTSSHHVGVGPDEPSSHAAGERIVLVRRLAVLEEVESSFSGTMGGVPTVSVDGEQIALDEALETGKYPGWRVWIRFDTEE